MDGAGDNENYSGLWWMVGGDYRRLLSYCWIFLFKFQIRFVLILKCNMISDCKKMDRAGEDENYSGLWWMVGGDYRDY